MPSLFFWYHSIVASFGAVPSALIETTCFFFASYSRMTASDPMPLLSGSTRLRTAWPATAASNALPPASRIFTAAAVASAFIELTAWSRPRRTGRMVRLDG